MTDLFVDQCESSSAMVGIFFEPTTTSTFALNGELTFGGIDSTKIVGSLTFTPISKYMSLSMIALMNSYRCAASTSPSSEFWGINQSIRYGASTTILSNTAGIVDTGTSLLMIASDAFSKYKTATGGVLDAATGLLRLSNSKFSSVQSLFFTIGGVRVPILTHACLLAPLKPFPSLLVYI